MVSVAPVGLGVGWMTQLVPFQRSASVNSVGEASPYHPAAVQAVADEQDTAVSWLSFAPVGLGVGWMTQVVPFQRSASVCGWPKGRKYDPTAVQEVADGQDTPSRSPCAVPVGLGVVWMDQAVPFQVSASVDVSPVEASLMYEPTAVHAVADRHETPSKEACMPGAGLGVGWIDQWVPFQCSASGTSSDEFVAAAPTAVQEVADEHETADRELSPAPGLGVGWIDQRVPFQCSASGTLWAGRLGFGWYPTAVQEAADRHDTLTSALSVGLGMGWIDQPVPAVAGTAPHIRAHAKDRNTIVKRRTLAIAASLAILCITSPSGRARVSSLVPWVPAYPSKRGWG
jgi:hypothetical protein